MVDGLKKYDTQDIEDFGGLIASTEHKVLFPDNATPYTKNFIMDDGSLEIRKGSLRQNATAYAGDILFLIPYRNKDNASILLLGKI